MIDGFSYEIIAERHSLSKSAISVLARRAYKEDGFIEGLCAEAETDDFR